MPSSISINGKNLAVPGVYGHIDTSALAGKQVSTGRTAIVGDFPAFEKNKPYVFTNPQALRGYDPSDLVLQRFAQLIFSPATDDRVTGAADVTLISTRTNSQAQATLVDADNQGALVLKAKKWGAKGNQVYYKVTANAGDNTLRDINLVAAYGNSENYPALGSGNVAKFKLDPAVCTELVAAAPVSDTTTITQGPTQFLWKWKKTPQAGGNPIGKNVGYTFTGNKLLVSGVLGAFFDQATPNVNPNIVTATATATGLRNDGTSVTATAVFDPGTAGGSVRNFKVGGVDVNWGRLDTVVWTTTGGDFANPNPALSLQGNAFDLNPALFNSVSDLVTFVNNSASKGWLATVLAPQAAVIPAAEMDSVSQTSVMNTDVFARADLWAVVKALANSGIVDASRAANSNNTPAAAEGTLVGGDDGAAATAAAYEAALAVLANEDVQIVTVFSTDIEMHKKLLQHCKDAPVVGAGERNGYVGCPTNLVPSSVKSTYAAVLNTRHLSVCAQDIWRAHPTTGQKEQLDPRYQAIQAMAMQAGTPIATPLTNKRPDVLETSQNWTVRTDDDTVIKAGIYAYTKDNLSYKVLRSITCWLTDDNVAEGEMSAVESGNTSVRRVRAQLQSKVGDPALNVTPGQFTGIVSSELDKQVTDGVIAGWKNLVLTPVADKYRVDYDYKPVVPINFIDVWAHAYV